VPVQKCPLCLETKQVVSSHLMPAGLYAYTSGPDGDHVSFNAEIMMATTRQLQHPLLCQACEENLNKNGENWMVPLFARYGGSFPFHDLLTKMPPAIVDGETRVFAAARNPDIKTDMLTHFAMGIFWKAAVHSWSGSETAPLIDLGPYTESVRQYLRGETGFPARMALMISVLPPPVKNISFSGPYRGANGEWHNFVLHVLGIEFMLFVGKAVGREQRDASFSGNPERPILLFDFSAEMQAVGRKVMQGAKKAQNVEKYLKKRTT
jgi:hypothetical protein